MLPSSYFIPRPPYWPSFLPTHTEYLFHFLEVKHGGKQGLGLLAAENVLKEGREEGTTALGLEQGGGGCQGKSEFRTQMVQYLYLSDCQVHG